MELILNALDLSLCRDRSRPPGSNLWLPTLYLCNDTHYRLQLIEELSVKYVIVLAILILVSSPSMVIDCTGSHRAVQLADASRGLG